MNIQLIQLPEQNIIVSDEKIKEDNWIVDIKNPLNPRQIKTKHLLEDLFESERKIIAADNIEGLPKIDYSALSEDDYGAIVNIDKLALDEHKYNHKSVDEISFKLGFKIGSKIINSFNEKKLVGNHNGSLDDFLLNSNLYTQEDREIIMNSICDWLSQPKIFNIEVETKYSYTSTEKGDVFLPEFKNNLLKILNIL